MTLENTGTQAEWEMGGQACGTPDFAADPSKTPPLGTISLELTCQLASAPAPFPHAHHGPTRQDRLAARPTPEFRVLIGPPGRSAPSAQPMGKPPRRSALPAGSGRSGSLRTRVVSRDGGGGGVRGPAAAAPRSPGRGTLASAAWRGAAAGLPAVRLGLRGCGPEAAGGSLHFPAWPGTRGVRWARGCPVRSAVAQSRRPVGAHWGCALPSSAGAGRLTSLHPSRVPALL